MEGQGKSSLRAKDFKAKLEAEAKAELKAKARASFNAKKWERTSKNEEPKSLLKHAIQALQLCVYVVLILCVIVDRGN